VVKLLVPVTVTESTLTMPAPAVAPAPMLTSPVALARIAHQLASRAGEQIGIPSDTSVCYSAVLYIDERHDERAPTRCSPASRLRSLTPELLHALRQRLGSSLAKESQAGSGPIPDGAAGARHRLSLVESGK